MNDRNRYHGIVNPGSGQQQAKVYLIADESGCMPPQSSLTVLVDNNTLIDHYFSGEPGLSFFIRTAGKNILFDIGYSDLFMTTRRIWGSISLTST